MQPWMQGKYHKNGGSSLDAVQATINVMENSEHFNAGKGAVFTHEGINELTLPS